MPVIAAASPTHCFDAAYDDCKIALEHMTPVVLLTYCFVAVSYTHLDVYNRQTALLSGNPLYI